MSLNYDAEKFSFAVVEENFLSYSSDSHVALVQGEDFSLQLEYAAYFSGEDFAAHCASLREKHPDLVPVRYGSVDAVKYLEGDSLCFCIPIPEDAQSYVQVLLFKAKGNDTPLPDLADDPDLALNARQHPLSTERAWAANFPKAAARLLPFFVEDGGILYNFKLSI